MAAKTQVGRLKSVGVDQLWKVPLYLPTGYLDCRNFHTSFKVPFFDNQKVIVVGQVRGNLQTEWRGGKPLTKGILADEGGSRLHMSFFGDPRHMEKEIENSSGKVILAGTIRIVGGTRFLNNPTLVDDACLGKLVPIYPGKAGRLSPSNARKIIQELLPVSLPLAATELRIRLGLMARGRNIREVLRYPHGTLEELLYSIHWPINEQQAETARKVVERMAALISVCEMRKTCAVPEVSRPPLHMQNWESILAPIQFALTDEQHEGIRHLVECLQRPQTSTTLINGDVGMGKSIIYQTAVAYTVYAGGRAAVLLPHSRLAAQAHAEIHGMWPDLKPLLVTNKCKAEDLRHEKLLVGTTALLHRNIGDIDLCVCDEQQRFSVSQRQKMASHRTHTIELSATPIPRTQAMLTYGSLNVVKLTKRHSRQDIRTHIITKANVWEMINHVKELIHEGSKLLIVCPKKENEDDVDVDYPLPSVEEVAAKWEKLFPGLVRKAHSGATEGEMAEAFDDIDSGKSRILVCTTVVETGLTLKDTRALIVVHAERFGVSQLHQLRGRLARHGGYGVCYLYLPRPIKEQTMERIQAVASTTDGLKLSELDMHIRGIGDLSTEGKKQHGSMDNIIFNIEVSTSLIADIVEVLE